jgi:hypothetical protein
MAGDDDVGVASTEYGSGRGRQEGVAVEQVAGGPAQQEEVDVGDEVVANRAWRLQPDAEPIVEKAGAVIRRGQDEENGENCGGQQFCASSRTGR